MLLPALPLPPAVERLFASKQQARSLARMHARTHECRAIADAWMGGYACERRKRALIAAPSISSASLHASSASWYLSSFKEHAAEFWRSTHKRPVVRSNQSLKVVQESRSACGNIVARESDFTYQYMTWCISIKFPCKTFSTCPSYVCLCTEMI